MMRWARQVADMGKRNVYRASVVKPDGKRPPERPTSRREDNTKMGV
jgi:hypothetical protein